MERLSIMTFDGISRSAFFSGILAYLIAMIGTYFLFIRGLLQRIREESFLGNPERRCIKWWVISGYLFFFLIAFTFWVGWIEDLCKRQEIYDSLVEIENMRSYKGNESDTHLLDLCDSLSIKISPSYKEALSSNHADIADSSFIGPINSQENLNHQLAIGTTIGRLKDHLRFYSDQSDAARRLYETRSIISYAGTIAIAAFAIVLPLLVALWNHARNTLSSKLDELIRLRGHKDIKNSVLLTEQISITLRETKVLSELGNSFRALYAAAVGFGLVFTLLLILATFARWDPFTDYIFSITLQGAIWLGFLWLSVLLVLYQILVQPIVRKNKPYAIYGDEFNQG